MSGLILGTFCVCVGVLSAASPLCVRKKGGDGDNTTWEEIDVKLNSNSVLVVNNVNIDSMATWLGGGSLTVRPRVVTWYNQSFPGVDIIAVGTKVWATLISNLYDSGVADQPAITADKVTYPIFEDDTTRVYCSAFAIPPGCGECWHSRSPVREVL